MILVQPDSASFGVGARVDLRCEASGVPTPVYTWLLNGVEIEGVAQIPTLSFDLLPETRGFYTCMASNDLGEESSDSAFITINSTFVKQVFPESIVIRFPVLVDYCWGGNHTVDLIPFST